MAQSAAGILMFGSYIPATRLPLAAVHGGRAKEGGAEKAVAGFDEDSITMAVAAGINCLGETERKSIDAVYFATTSSPFREKQAATFIARALDLRSDIETIDFSSTLRSAASALLSAVQAVQACPQKRVLVIAADSRLAAPRSSLEMQLGDAAAAFLIGSGEIVATISDSFSYVDEIYDVWRAEHDNYLRSWEERFNVMHGYSDNMLAACRGLLQHSCISASAFSKVILASPDSRSLTEVALALNVDLDKVQDPLFGKVGNCGAAFAPLLLVAALEHAAPGDRFLVGFYGDGAHVLSVDAVTLANTTQHTIAAQISSGRPLRNYDSYLKSRHLDVGEHDRRGGEGVPATVHFRERDSDINFLGQRCTQCDTVHFPACRVCYVCYAKDQFEAVRLSDRQGRVLSYSFDYFFPSPEPPVIVGMCEVDNGARVYLQMTEAATEQLCCDLPVEFVFRKIHDAGNKPNYFWKSKPLTHVTDISAAEATL